MKKLNILIISRIIFPANSPRAFRTTELATELARQGHLVTLYAVLGKYDYTKYEKETGVKVRNIGKMRFATSDSDGQSRYTLLDKILYHSLHRLIEFPDIEFIFKVPGIIKKEKGTDMLITIAFPHPIHWGAALARKRISYKEFPKTWISDCGDPYMGDSINKKKFLYFRYVEKCWCKNTDFITIPLEEGKDGYYREFHPKIKIIPQGFDFDKVKINHPFVPNEIPTFAYSGSIYPGKRDPKLFLDFLTSVDLNFRFIIYTNTPDYYIPYKSVLKEKLIINPYIPREQLLFELSKMDFLVNLNNPNNIQLPSKLIDYLLTRRPIMNISSDFSDSEESLFVDFYNGIYIKRLNNYNLDQFNIKIIAKKFTDLHYENL